MSDMFYAIREMAGELMTEATTSPTDDSLIHRWHSRQARAKKLITDTEFISSHSQRSDISCRE